MRRCRVREKRTALFRFFEKAGSDFHAVRQHKLRGYVNVSVVPSQCLVIEFPLRKSFGVRNRQKNISFETPPVEKTRFAVVELDPDDAFADILRCSYLHLTNRDVGIADSVFDDHVRFSSNFRDDLVEVFSLDCQLPGGINLFLVECKPTNEYLHLLLRQRPAKQIAVNAYGSNSPYLTWTCGL